MVRLFSLDLNAMTIFGFKFGAFDRESPREARLYVVRAAIDFGEIMSLSSSTSTIVAV